MNFKKFFSHVIVGLIATTLFSNSSFAMETKSDKRIVVISNTSNRSEARKYVSDSDIPKAGKTDVSWLYVLTDDAKKVYCKVRLSENNIPNWYGEHALEVVSFVTNDEFKGKGYGKLLLKNVLDDYKNRTFYLYDYCSVCNHDKNQCFYQRFGFTGDLDHSDSKMDEDEELDKKLKAYGETLTLKKGENDINYQGNQNGLRKLEMIRL